ncbi:MAG: DUF4352 domain-containing protein [Clostridiales bacterium]|nr:DUF4352 domain-containing protein [Clostridiales bacterium]
MKLKRSMGILVATVLIFSFVGCSSTDTSAIEASEIDELYTSPENFVGRTFEFTAQILDIDKDNGTLYIQAFYDITNYEKNTYIEYADPDNSLNLSSDDYIKVKGTIEGEMSGENLLGTTVSMPKVKAESVEEITAMDAFKAEKTVEVDQTVSNGNGAVTITKVDYTDTETRVYVTAQNTGSGNFSIYSYSAVAVQSGKQFETSYHFDYPELSSDIAAGASSEGVITFDRLDESDFTIIMKGCDSDYNEYEYSFTISVS